MGHDESLQDGRHALRSSKSTYLAPVFNLSHFLFSETCLSVIYSRSAIAHRVLGLAFISSTVTRFLMGRSEAHPFFLYAIRSRY